MQSIALLVYTTIPLLNTASAILEVLCYPELVWVEVSGFMVCEYEATNKVYYVITSGPLNCLLQLCLVSPVYSWFFYLLVMRLKAAKVLHISTP